MEITFWGVRGLIPAPGPQFLRYGGNTCCISIRTSNGDLLILDAGTGITFLGHELMQGPFGQGAGKATLLLSHAHWDHIQGFPFFSPIYVPGNRLEIYGPGESPAIMEGILEGQMNPHFSPVHSLRNLGAEMGIHATPADLPLEKGTLSITSAVNPHGQTQALAYRIQERDAVMIYAPDAGYINGEPSAEIIDFYGGADYLIHDTTYSVADQKTRVSRGYSSIANAARVAALAGVKALVMFHYDQDYCDDQIDDLKIACRDLLDQEPGGKEIALIASREGLTISA